MKKVPGFVTGVVVGILSLMLCIGCVTTQPDGATTEIDTDAIVELTPVVALLVQQLMVLNAQLELTQSAAERAELREDVVTIVDILVDLGVFPESL